MKKTDIAMIILIASISAITAYLVVGALPLFEDANTPVSVKTIDAISPDIAEVDKSVFNKDAINPTVEVILEQASTDSSASVGQDPATVTQDGE